MAPLDRLPPAAALAPAAPTASSAVTQAAYQEPIRPAEAQKPDGRPLPPPAKLPEAAKTAPDQPPPRPGDTPPEPPAPATPVPGSPASQGGPLALGEVLQSVEAHYPLLRAAEEERAVTGGRLLTTYGAFDLNLVAGASGKGPATYDNFQSNFGVVQGLPVAGVGLFAGYRNGYGEFPTYNLGQKTADGGEFTAGVSLPLLRDRAIDRPRAAVQQAAIDQQLAEPLIQRQRLDFARAAARSYWAWVAAGRRVEAVAGIAKVAVLRDEQIRLRVEAKAAANIERKDNQQVIAQRNFQLVQAQREFQQAAIDLSLFLRDDAGRPTLAGEGRLPGFPEAAPVTPAEFDAALATAFQARPELLRLRLQREKAAVELRLAENLTLPALNAVVSGTADAGFGKSSLSGPNGLDRAALNAGLTYQLPVQRREALGRIATAQAQLRQIALQYRQAEDVVRADVQDAYSAAERAYELLRQATERVEGARLLAQSERDSLVLGRSDILRVTIREGNVLEAEVSEISARQLYFRAQADLRAAAGVLAP